MWAEQVTSTLKHHHALILLPDATLSCLRPFWPCRVMQFLHLLILSLQPRSLFDSGTSLLPHVWLLLYVCVRHPCCFCLVDHSLCVSVPPHDVKRMAWNSTGNSSCPDSELSQSSMPAAPLGSNTVAAKSNTKQSKNTPWLTDISFLCWLPTASVALSSLKWFARKRGKTFCTLNHSLNPGWIYFQFFCFHFKIFFTSLACIA